MLEQIIVRGLSNPKDLTYTPILCRDCCVAHGGITYAKTRVGGDFNRPSVENRAVLFWKKRDPRPMSA